MSHSPPLPPRLRALQKRLVGRIPCASSEDQCHLAGVSFPNVIRAYVGYASRYIPPRKRNFFYANMLTGTEISAGVEREIGEIRREIVQGKDLRPRLSRRLDSHGYSAKFGWQDKDFALNAYDLHHLHFKKTSKGGQSDKLMFARFDKGSATIVHLGDHSSFGKTDLETAFLAHRADTGEAILKGVTGAANSNLEFTDEERRKLAWRGFTTTSNLPDGRVMIAASVTSTGASERYERHAIKILRKLFEFEDGLGKRRFVKSLFDKHEMRAPQNPKFSWHFDYTSLVLCENVSSTAFPLVESPLGYSSELLNRWY